LTNKSNLTDRLNTT